MENKVYLWISLILGVPAIRLLEVMAVSRATPGFGQVHYSQFALLGLVVGVACALAAKILKLEGWKLVFVPVLALGYAALLLRVTYPAALFRMDPVFVGKLLALDFSAWAIAVGGATFIGAIASRARTNVVPVAARYAR